MRVIFSGTIIVIVPENESEISIVDNFGHHHRDNVFRLSHSGTGIQLFDLGPSDEARNVAINITSSSPAPLDLISNFAATPFDLDGHQYASVEGFWQALKFDDLERRSHLAGLAGLEAKRAGIGATYGEIVHYDGTAVRTGTWDHWQLMRRACAAKFDQNADARESLLATGERPLLHKVRRDSRIIPGVVMAEIWMQERRRLRERPPVTR